LLQAIELILKVGRKRRFIAVISNDKSSYLFGIILFTHTSKKKALLLPGGKTRLSHSHNFLVS